MLELVIDQRRRSLGGFEVGRVLPFAKRRMVGPFIFFDHMGPIDFSAAPKREADVRPHPHIGLSTVTYLFDGEIMHRDSVGSEQPIQPGAVNWMVAGSGITHSERFERARAEGGGPLHGIQSWVALPDGEEETAPEFAHHPETELPALVEQGLRGRLIAGTGWGLVSPVRAHSPMFYAHLALDAGTATELPGDHTERAAYVVSGAVEADGRRCGPGQMLVFAPGGDAVVSAVEPSVVMALGGAPVGERFIEWNFVSSSKERIEQAKADWRAGRMKLPDLDHDEWIPLPDDPVPPAPPGS
jgi:redox-sensitive bicupin YhaK (pirin superfamily)